MPPHRKTRPLRFLLQRWHRRLGALSAILMILAAVTGLALNHTDDLHLGSSYPHNAVLLWPYQAVLEPSYVIETGSGTLSATEGGLILEGEWLADCEALLAFTAMETGKLVSCGEQWHLFDTDWQLLETLDPELIGLRGDETLGTAGGQLLVNMGGQWQQLDSATFELLGPVPGDDVVVMAMTEIKENHTISWQRLMQDLHSGRWFGYWGVWMMDVAAVILLLLALSGLWMWWGRGRRSR